MPRRNDGGGVGPSRYIYIYKEFLMSPWILVRFSGLLFVCMYIYIYTHLAACMLYKLGIYRGLWIWGPFDFN